MQTIENIFGPRRRGGRIGIEIEVEGLNIPKEAVGVWNAIADGSLRGEAREYVTDRPLDMEEVHKATKKLEDKFKELNSQVFEAHRGSVHMHVNVQKNTLPQMFGLMFQWSIYEGLWMHLCGPTRESNLFCTPGATSGDLAAYARKFLSCVRSEAYHNFPAHGKYASLNFDPIGRYGSVEFRTFASTIDTDTICKYAGWCDRMVTKGTRTDLDNLTETWKTVLAQPMEKVREIFGNETAEGLDPNMVKYFIEQGAENAANMSLVWANHKLLKNKKPEVKVRERWAANGDFNLGGAEMNAVDALRQMQQMVNAARVDWIENQGEVLNQPVDPARRQPRIRRPMEGL